MIFTELDNTITVDRDGLKYKVTDISGRSFTIDAITRDPDPDKEWFVSFETIKLIREFISNDYREPTITREE